MSLQKLLQLPFRYRPWQPLHVRLVLADLVGSSKAPAGSHEEHLQATIDWLCRAQDVRAGGPGAGGVAAGFSFEDGWLPSYPETTGYIIETFLAAAEILKREDLRVRAGRMVDWELSLQAADGAFPGHFGEPGSHPVIFNQGQILHGLVAAAVHLQRADARSAALRGGRWMVAHQDQDGCWRRFEHHDTPHVYNTRATWGLLAAGILCEAQELIEGARKNLDWALTQQTPSGWYRTNAFTPDKDPFTHTIAYAIRGFLECGALLDESRYIESAARAARGLLEKQATDGSIAGTYADGFVSSAGYVCVTGVAQMALCWLRLAQLTGAEDFRRAARRAIGYVKTTQRRTDPNAAVRGAIPGSRPIWGAYSRFEFPNWAAKFFADALMIDMTDEPVPTPIAHKKLKEGVL